MSWKFYNSVIEEECKLYGLGKHMIKPAFKTIANAYCEKTLKTGDTFVDYEDPRNRCAYLHKFAALHTSLVSQYFSRILHEEKERRLLMSKQTLTICCLGGGPGCDIIGIFRALTQFPEFRRRVVRVVVLDICRGWCNSFKFIVSSLLEGKINKIPADFVDASKFVSEIIEVNLLEPLPGNVVEAIAAADIVCSIKFVSAIYSDPASLRAMKAITSIIKPHAVFLFIDNLKDSAHKLVETASEASGFSIILGPLHEKFSRYASTKSRVAFEYSPTLSTLVSVIGMMKFKKSGRTCNSTMLNPTPNMNDSDDNCTSDAESKTERNVNGVTKSNSSEVNEFISANTSTTFGLSNFDAVTAIQLRTVFESLATALDSLRVNIENTFSNR